MSTSLLKGSRRSWRDRFDHVPGQARPNRIRTGAIFVAFSVIFVWIIYTKPTLPGLGKDGRKITAEFDYASNLYPGRTPVRVQGVDVGLVKKVERAPSGRGVLITMQIDDGRGVQLHQDARMAVRWKTLLGRNMYVDIDEGSPSAPDFKGDFFPRSRTSNQVELDTALEPLDARGRKAVQTTLHELEDVFADPRALGRTIDAVQPAMRPMARGLSALRGSRPGADLPTLVASTSRAMAALAHDEAALAGVIDHGNVALGVTAARRAELASTVASVPAAMRETRATMTRLIKTLDETDPLATKLLPGARRLDGAAARTQRTLDAAMPLLRDLRPTLRDLRPAVRDVSTASAAGAPAFGPLTRVMERTNSKFLPWLKSKEPDTGFVTYQTIGPALAGAGSALAYGDIHGPVANFEAGFGESAGTVESPCKTYIADPRASLTEKVQCELMARALAGLYTSRRPSEVRFSHSAVQENVLKKYMTGRKRIEFVKRRRSR